MKILLTLLALLFGGGAAPKAAEFHRLPDCYEMVVDCAYREDGTLVKAFIHRGKYRYTMHADGTVTRDANPYYKSNR